MDRRAFLTRAARFGGGAALGGSLLGALAGCDTKRDSAAERAASAPRIIDGKPSDAPVETVVIVMMENRSFDHYLGWLGRDGAYLDAGRRAYGRSFHLNGDTQLVYADAEGTLVPTAPLTVGPDELQPFRGCGHPVPGHGWFTGRAQRDRGFLAEGTGNDEYAIGWFGGDDVPFYRSLAHRFTVADRHFASLLTGTFPNRQYLHAATSLGLKDDPVPLEIGIYPGETIWDRLGAAGVSARYYYTDLPVLALWGPRNYPRIRRIDDFFEDAERGDLPHVVMVDPGFGGALRSDDHPNGSIHVGQRFVRSVLRAFTRSPQWEHGALFLTYDEWGGFFDHVPPAVFADDRASLLDVENFGQAGFRVPSIVASPYARPGWADHTVYDHTSILRFLEWRFLGAPAEGPRARGGRPWWLTARDRNARNIGASLVTASDPELGFDVDQHLALPGPECTTIVLPTGGVEPVTYDPGTTPQSEAFQAVLASRFPPATETPWL